MAGTFNTSFVTEIILKLPELNHSTEIYAKYHLNNKLLNYNLILKRDIIHELGIIFHFENKSVTWQPTKLNGKRILCNQRKSPNKTRYATKRIKLIRDAEYKKINLKSIIMNLNYLKDKHTNSL